MIYFVGAGPGAPDLITVRGKMLLEQADVIIYTGSLVNPALLSYAKETCRIYDSASMTLEDVIAVMEEAEAKGHMTVRLHTGDPSIFGAIREQMDILAASGIAFAIVPGVSSFCAAAAAVQKEYTLPDVSQSVIITRAAGRTPVPDRQHIADYAAHGATMVIFLSAGLLDAVQRELLCGGYTAKTPAAIVYKASWPDEQVLPCTVGTLAETARQGHITKTALVLVGDFLGTSYRRSQLYDPAFSHGYRNAGPEEARFLKPGDTE